MDTVQVLKYFFVELGQFFIGPHSSVLAALVAFLFAGTSFTVFALVIFFCPSVLGSLYRCFPQEVRLLPVGEDHMAFVVYIKIRCPASVIPIFRLYSKSSG